MRRFGTRWTATLSALALGLGIAVWPERGPAPYSARPEAAIEHYRQIVERGGWPAVTAGAELREGDQGHRVSLVRARLAATADLDPAAATASDRFDTPVTEAVVRFQRRHGLPETGTVDEPTLRALNVPAEQRLGVLELNAPRWNELPEDPGPRYVVINIPDFRLAAVEAGTVLLRMKVVVGKVYQRTPSFTRRCR